MGIDISKMSPELQARVVKGGQVDMAELEKIAASGVDKDAAEASRLLQEGLGGGLAWGQVGDTPVFSEGTKDRVAQNQPKDVTFETKAIEINTDKLGKIVNKGLEILGNLLTLGTASCTKPEDIKYPGNTTNINNTITINLSNASVDELIAQFKEQNEKLNVIIDLLTQANRNTTDILAVLAGLGKKVDEIDNYLVEISKGNQDIKELLVKIYNKQAEGVKIGENNNAVLNEILNKLKELGDNDAAKVDLLKQILAKITEDVEQDKDMNEVTKNLLETILAKIGTMDANQQAFFNAILAKIDTIGDKGKAALEELLAAINANTAIAEGSQELLAKILEKIEKLGDKADVVIDLIKNLAITGGGTVDLTDVTELLKQILAQEKANGDTLKAIYDKIDVIPAKLDAIIAKFDGLPQAGEYTALLEQIRDKIKPCEGHNCDHGDLAQILLEIKVIIEGLKEKIGDDPRHEGILDDLDDLLG